MNPFNSVNELLRDVKIEKQRKKRVDQHVKNHKYKYLNQSQGKVPIVGSSSVSSKSVYRIKSLPMVEIDDKRVLNCNFHSMNINCDPWNPGTEWCIVTHFDENDYFAINSFQRSVWNDTLKLFLKLSEKLDVHYICGDDTSRGQWLEVGYDMPHDFHSDDKVRTTFLESELGRRIEKYDMLIYANFKNVRAFTAFKAIVLILIKRMFDGCTLVCDVHDVKVMNVRRAIFELHGLPIDDCCDCLFIKCFPFMASILTIAGLPLIWFAIDKYLLLSASEVIDSFGLTLLELISFVNQRDSATLVDSAIALLHLSKMDGLTVKQNTSQLARFDFGNATKVVMSAVNLMLSEYGSQLKYVAYADRSLNPRRNKLVIAIPFAAGCTNSTLRKIITATNIIFMGALLRTGACSFHYYELAVPDLSTVAILGDSYVDTNCTCTGGMRLKRSEFNLSAKMHKVIVFNWRANGVTMFTEPRDPSSNISYINIKIDYLTGDLPSHFLNTMSDYMFSVFRDILKESQKTCTFYKRTDSESRLIFEIHDEQGDLCKTIIDMLSDDLKSGDNGYVYASMAYSCQKFRKILISSNIPQELIVNVTVVYSGDENIDYVATAVSVFIMETEIVKLDLSLLDNSKHYVVDID